MIVSSLLMALLLPIAQRLRQTEGKSVFINFYFCTCSYTLVCSRRTTNVVWWWWWWWW